jgi:tetratricopeptide (TPR) repeat protein
MAEAVSAELTAGIAARDAGDLTSARRHFEAAAAGDDDRSAADALYLLGEMSEVALDFPAAITAYQSSAKRLPSGRYTPRAQRRASELRSHSEGGFAPLVELETLRRSPALADDPRAIDALVAHASAFPPGKVRVEARMLAAEAFAGRLHRPDDALPLLEQVATDKAAEVLMARAAAAELLRAYIAREDYARALALTETSGTLLPPTAKKDLLRAMRRRPLRMAAFADLGLLALAALVAVGRPGRARVIAAVSAAAPMALVFASLACGAAGYLASRYEQTNPLPFTAMLPAIFVISLLSRAWSARGSRAPLARALRATVAFAGVFAAAFLVLDRMDPVYLSGFGL